MFKVRLCFEIYMIFTPCLIKRDGRRISISAVLFHISLLFLSDVSIGWGFLPSLFAPCFSSSILLRHRSCFNVNCSIIM